MVIEKDLLNGAAVEEVIKEPVDENTEQKCCHHWVIESANGPVSRGECQICHESKEFKNSISDADREY